MVKGTGRIHIRWSDSVEVSMSRIAPVQVRTEREEMRAVLYRPSWQALRISFLKENCANGGWTTTTGAKENLESLQHYVFATEERIKFQALTEARSMDYSDRAETSARIFRGINLLNATRMGYSGQGRAGSVMDIMVRDFRDGLQNLQTMNYFRELELIDEKWNWDQVERELRGQYVAQPQVFDLVHKDLLGRAATATRRQIRVSRTRQELVMYLALCDKVAVHAEA